MMTPYPSDSLNLSIDELKTAPNARKEFEKRISKKIANLKVGESFVEKNPFGEPVRFFVRTPKSIATLDLTQNV